MDARSRARRHDLATRPRREADDTPRDAVRGGARPVPVRTTGPPASRPSTVVPVPGRGAD
ncbi:hypothetical protein IU11_03245 [Cellulosimicrobium sp. MM]|nr:hypothetical protein IU11_03245 [Cellulosimicrobium sp. MM]